MLDANLKAICPWCLNEETLKNIDDYTYNECTNREMRREFKHMTNELAFGRGKPYYFKCPICHTWSAGYKFRVPGTKYQGENIVGKEVDLPHQSEYLEESPKHLATPEND